MAKLKTPDIGSSSVNPRTIWAVLCNYAEWCGSMSRAATNRPSLRIEWILILHLFARLLNSLKNSMSQVNVRDLWLYPGLYGCLRIPSIHILFSSILCDSYFKPSPQSWNSNALIPFTFRRKTCLLVRELKRGGGKKTTQTIKENLFNSLTSNLPTCWYLDQSVFAIPMFSGPHPLLFRKIPLLLDNRCASLFLQYKCNAWWTTPWYLGCLSMVLL